MPLPGLTGQMDETAAIRDFIEANLPLVAVPFVPEIKVHKSTPTSGLARLAARDDNFTSPYWAHFWSGGLVLARYVLDHPTEVAGKRVLDLGTGSGIVAIAAALAGASEVTGADIDPYAIAAAGMNAAANSVSLVTHFGDLTSDPPPAIDVVTVGDLFYEPATAERVTRFLDRCAEGGAHILIGDPWRAYLPQHRLDRIATYHVGEASGVANMAEKPSGVFTLAR
jgi:predicted nicotinamide N-methyase